MVEAFVEVAKVVARRNESRRRDRVNIDPVCNGMASRIDFIT